MNFKYVNKNKYIVKINSSYLNLSNDNIMNSLKEILINIKKRYNIDIYGFFDVDLYEISNFLYVLEFNKKDSDEYFYKTVDLKIKKHNKKLSFILDDFLIDNENIYKMCEHYFIHD